VKFTKDLASKVIGGLVYGSFEQYADEPAEGDEALQEWVDELASLKGKHGPDMVTALAEFVEDYMHEDVQPHEVEDFAQRTFKGSGHAKGEVLKAFAEHHEFDLGKLWDRLDKSGGVDYFDWDGYADGGSILVNGLAFIEAPTTGRADTVYLFEGD
jgi:hypothetical protein